MTDDTENDEIEMTSAALSEDLNDDEFLDDDEAFESDSEDLESMAGELSPSELFGFDPLDVLTLEELADYLKISPATVRRAIKDQNLPGRNIGGEWRFLRDAVANWLRGQDAPAVKQQQSREAFTQEQPRYSAPQDDDQPRYSRPPRRPFQSDQSGGGQYRSQQRFTENRYSAGGESFEGGYESRPPRQPFRSYENRGEGYQREGSGYNGGNNTGYRFSGPPKRKNKRQAFEKQRGKRMDRRKEDNDLPEGQD